MRSLLKRYPRWTVDELNFRKYKIVRGERVGQWWQKGESPVGKSINPLDYLPSAPGQLRDKARKGRSQSE